jgi:hypothetical protein
MDEIMRSGLISSLFVSLCVLAAKAPERPDFSGEWRAVMEDGNLIPPYLGEHISIAQRESAFTVTSPVEGGNPVVFRFGADGKEHANTTRKMNVRTTARWDGDALLLTSHITAANGQVATARERWTLSPNKRKLSMQGHFVHGTTKETGKNQLLEYQRK